MCSHAKNFAERFLLPASCFPLISVETHADLFADASCYQTQCLTISKLLLSVTESLEYFPITAWQRCAALMSLPVLCDPLIAQSPFSFMLHLPVSLFAVLFL